MKLHHLGFACAELSAAKRQLLEQWPMLSAGPETYDPGQDATLCLLQATSGPAYELVSGPAVSGMLKKGLALYHICFEVEGLEEALERLQGQGYRMVKEPQPAPLFEGRRVAFVHGILGLVELLERP